MSREEDRSSLVAHRLWQMDDALRTAHAMLEQGFYNGTVNRAYYAMFYAVHALALSNSYTGKTHKGMVVWFDSEYVKTGKVSRETSAVLRMAFSARQQNDYEEIIQQNFETAEKLLHAAEHFVAVLKTLFPHDRP
jgi:uncharacterized protein (UPF0332 family)